MANIGKTANRAPSPLDCFKEFRQEFWRYNIPKLSNSESLFDYGAKLMLFMQISYRNVEKGKRGAKSLIQCLKVPESA